MIPRPLRVVSPELGSPHAQGSGSAPIGGCVSAILLAKKPTKLTNQDITKFYKSEVDKLYEKTAKDWDSISLLTGKLEN
jgi:hypothetical protein